MYVLVKDPIPEGEKGSLGWEKGFRVTQFTLHEDDGTELGYIKLAYWTEDSVAEAYPTIWHYKYHRGWTGILDVLGDPYALYHKIQGYRRFGYYGSLQELRNQPLELIQSLLRDLEEEYAADLEQDKAYFVDRPYIDYIKIHEPYRRRGYATLLYQTAVHWFSPTPIRSSTLQTEEAEGLWSSFTQKGWTEPAQAGDKECFVLLPESVPDPEVPFGTPAFQKMKAEILEKLDQLP